jgi:hypothetical protein
MDRHVTQQSGSKVLAVRAAPLGFACSGADSIKLLAIPFHPNLQGDTFDMHHPTVANIDELVTHLLKLRI